MVAQPFTLHRFTIDDVYEMLRANILHEDDPVELIDGKLIDMAAVGDRHIYAVDALTRIIAQAAEGVGFASIQSPMRISDISAPEPDVVVYRGDPGDYVGRGRTAVDALLVIEVSDSTLVYDRRVKLPVYARAGIPEVWIVNVNAGHIDIFREPSANGYEKTSRHSRQAIISPHLLPQLQIRVADVVPRWPSP